MIFHPVHVSMTSIEHVSGTDSIKVFMRMYFDDFLLDSKLSGKEMSPGKSPADKNFPAALVNKYINEKVNIFADNKPLEGKLIDMHLEDNEISVNFLYLSPTDPGTVRIRNLILTGVYSDQTNMTLVRIGDIEEGVKFTPAMTERTFSLK